MVLNFTLNLNVMLATETKKHVRNHEVFQLNNAKSVASEFVSSYFEKIQNHNEPHGKPVKNVSKSYEIIGGAINESFFNTDYSEEEIDFIKDFAGSYKNGIILIMTDKMTEDEISYFTENMKSKLKFIIYYSGDASQFNLNHTKGLTFIRTFSLKSAVAEAYRKAKNGQAILFPKIDSNFDFFQYIDNLN
jgi:hypothetical protein